MHLGTAGCVVLTSAVFMDGKIDVGLVCGKSASGASLDADVSEGTARAYVQVSHVHRNALPGRILCTSLQKSSEYRPNLRDLYIKGPLCERFLVQVRLVHGKRCITMFPCTSQTCIIIAATARV